MQRYTMIEQKTKNNEMKGVTDNKWNSESRNGGGGSHGYQDTVNKRIKGKKDHNLRYLIGKGNGTLHMLHSVSATERPKTTKSKLGLPFSTFKYPLDVNLSQLVLNYSYYGKVDYQPINVYPYAFIKTPSEDLCEAEIVLLLIIKSSPLNYSRRRIIRETWANASFFNGSESVKHVFTMGFDKRFEQHVVMEHSMFDDILQMDFQDSYYNNTLKLVGAINWATRYCDTATFLMFVDDDFFVATDRVVNFLKHFENETKNLFLGHVVNRSPPWRLLHHKWYTPYSDYPFDEYPPFCSAGSIFVSMEFAKTLQIAIQYTKHFKYDDVFFGIVLYKLGIKPQNTNLINVGKQKYTQKNFFRILSSHGYGSRVDLVYAWRCHTQNICFAPSLLNSISVIKLRTGLYLTALFFVLVLIVGFLIVLVLQRLLPLFCRKLLKSR